MPTLEAERAPELEVTAVSPSSGQTKVLDREELDHLFTVLTGYETALYKEGDPEIDGWELTAAKLKFSGEFRNLGVDIGWFSEKPSEDRPLFIAKCGSVEKTGYRLKDLLGIARETGALDAPPAPQDPGAAQSPHSKKVCVVDDEETVRDMLSFALRHEGFQVSACADGTEMVKEFDAPGARLPDLILLDLMMPFQSGYEILRQLQMGPTKDIPVIVITGRMIDRDMSRIMLQENNVAEFLQKPLHPKQLLMMVHGLLKTSPKTRV